MGYVTVAKCSCGFQSEELACGAGMRYFETQCDAPVICSACGYVETENIFDEMPTACPRCSSNDIEVAAVKKSRLAPPPERIAAWSVKDDQTVFFLPGPYSCPACKKRELLISWIGLWD
jgi:RNA polymerase subunit RPABC4/transcription elongation factor Spt4